MAQSKWPEVQEKLILIEAWCRDGLTEEQIAKNLGIGVSTLSKYKVEHIEIVEALKRGKEVIDYQVENQLLKRAMGYEYEEVTQEPLYTMSGTPILDESGNPKIAVTKIVKKQIVPDTTAQIFWLKNRKPKEWRDKQDIELSGDVEININLQD